MAGQPSVPRPLLVLAIAATLVCMSQQAAQFDRKEIDVAPLRASGLPIIWVLGGPGSGKGTQCDHIVQKYGFTHLSSGDLLRAEVKSGSHLGHQLTTAMEKGELVPLDVVLDLLKTTMLAHLQDSKGFLLDGYPRDAAQGEQFEREIAPCGLVLFFNASDEVLISRLLRRGESSGRVDDNAETIALRLKTFHEHSRPVVQKYAEKCREIHAEREPAEIFKEVVEAIDGLLAKKAA